MRCLSCNFENQEGARFCNNCGALLQKSEHICTICGTKLRENSIYCDRCGHKIVNENKEKNLHIQNTPKELNEENQREKQLLCLRDAKSFWICFAVFVVSVFCVLSSWIHMGIKDDWIDLVENYSTFEFVSGMKGPGEENYGISRDALIFEEMYQTIFDSWDAVEYDEREKEVGKTLQTMIIIGQILNIVKIVSVILVALGIVILLINSFQYFEWYERCLITGGILLCVTHVSWGIFIFALKNFVTENKALEGYLSVNVIYYIGLIGSVSGIVLVNKLKEECRTIYYKFRYKDGELEKEYIWQTGSSMIKKHLMQGENWECPDCGRINANYIGTCACGREKI